MQTIAKKAQTAKIADQFNFGKQIIDGTSSFVSQRTNYEHSFSDRAAESEVDRLRSIENIIHKLGE